MKFFWSDDFDMDLPKVLPDWKECLGEAASIELRTHGGLSHGKLNHPSVWNSPDGMTAFCGLFLDAAKPDLYSTDRPLVSCTFAELVRDVWVHQCLVRVQGIAVIDTQPLLHVFDQLMWHVRKYTELPEQTVIKHLNKVRTLLKMAGAKLVTVKLSCARTEPWVLVTGGRDYGNRQHVFGQLDDLHAKLGIERLIHGACGWDADKPWNNTFDRLRGADRWADEWASERGVLVSRCPANWTTLKRRAGPLRNDRMFQEFVPNHVMRFPGGSGTAGTIALAVREGSIVIDATVDRCVGRSGPECFGTPGTPVDVLPLCDCGHGADAHQYSPGARHSECNDCSCVRYQTWGEWFPLEVHFGCCEHKGEISSRPMCKAEDMGGWPACSAPATLRTRDPSPKCYCDSHKINRHVWPGDMLDPIYVSCLGEP